MSNILTAVFGNGRSGSETEARTASAWQYDYGMVLKFEGLDLPLAYEVHFANSRRGDSVTSIGGADGVAVPDAMFLTGETIYAWVYLHTGESDGETQYMAIIPVHDRAKPTNEEPTPVQQDVITQTIAALQDALTKGPKIIDGQWYTWDAEESAFVNTEVDATGPTGNGISRIVLNQDYTLTFYYTNGDSVTTGSVRGQAGFSPSVEVTEITGGHRVAVTDESGTETFDVMDGEALIDDSTTALNKSWSSSKINITKVDKENPAMTGTLSHNRKTGESVGQYSVALGYNCIASGAYSYAEGQGTTASGAASHAEGIGTNASGNNAHAEGAYTYATNYQSHAEGANTTASGSSSHAEGSGSNAAGEDSHAEGKLTRTQGPAAHSEGYKTEAMSSYSHAEGNSTTASGSAAHSEGTSTAASGSNAHAEGAGTTASGDCSHAEGAGCTASSTNAHAEGAGTTASYANAHAEGAGTKAQNYQAHAEGASTTASGSQAHAEGVSTTASGNNSHAEGQETKATYVASHAEGYKSEANNNYSHAEGNTSKATGAQSHAEGNNTTAGGASAHAEGSSTTASGNSSHAEGGGTNASATNSHAEGGGTQATGEGSHAEGAGARAVQSGAHAEGGGTYANAAYSHAEGTGTTTSGYSSHAEGSGSTASGTNAHAEGSGTTASGNSSHAEGGGAIASGAQSHAEGSGTVASGAQSHAEGLNTTANHLCQHTFGAYNAPDPSTEGSTLRGNYVEIVGNGYSNHGSNARALDWSGNERLAGSLYVGCNSDSSGGKKVLSTDDLVQNVVSNQNVAGFADGADNKAMSSVVVEIIPTQEGSGDPSPTNIRPIVGCNGCNVYHAPTSDPDDPDKETYTYTWPPQTSISTVYGGTLDIISGVLTITAEIITIGDALIPWNYNSNKSRMVTSYFVGRSKCPVDDDTPLEGLLCSSYATQSANNAIPSVSDKSIACDHNGYVYIADSDYTTAEAFVTAMGDQTIVYPLNYPITYQMAKKEVSTLLGQNYVWTDVGKIKSLKYTADTKLYIDQKFAALQALIEGD